jgi:NAD(P)-dependent dehydrogenase (short-subunit alcohol dehydrogenase family)
MSYGISTLLLRNLNDVFGENASARRRATVDEIFQGTAAQSEEHKRNISEQQAIKRSGEHEDVTDAVAFLTSDDAGSITGEAIVVDGSQPRIGRGRNDEWDQMIKRR